VHPAEVVREVRILRAMHANPRQLRGGILRKLLIVIALLVVVVAIAAVFFLDSIARVGIEAAGKYVLGTRTTVREASIGLVSGKTAIRGLSVDNPAGFSPSKFVALDEIAVNAGLSSFTGDKIVIDRVALTGLVVEIEKDGSGVLNVQKFSDHIKKVTGGGAVAGAGGEQKPAPTGESKEAVIRELRLGQMRVNLRNVAGGKDGVVEVKLPDLVVRDLSSKGGVDVLASELSGVVIGSVMKSVIAANIEGIGSEVLGGMKGAVEGIGGVIGEGLLGSVNLGVKGVEEALKGIGKGLGDLGKGAGEALKGAGEKLEKGVGEALDGIFGGKKK